MPSESNCRPSRSVVLYTRQGCHLCDDALAILHKYQARCALSITLCDIDQDPELQRQYDCYVPVVMIDGKVRFWGRINEVLLRRQLGRA